MSQDLSTDAVRKGLDLTSSAVLMDNELYGDDIDNLKFLCQGMVMGSKLKRVGDPHELVSLLEKGSYVTSSDTFLLADLLQCVGRMDVLQKMGFRQEEVIQHRHLYGSKLSPFHMLLFQLAEELTREEVKKASFMYGKVPRTTKVSSGLDLFSVMLQHEAIQPENVGRLIDIFTALERFDLVESINTYTATKGQSVIDNLAQNFKQAMTLHDIKQEEPLPQAPKGDVPFTHINYPEQNVSVSTAVLPQARLENLDTYGIPEKVMDALCKKIPAESFPEFSNHLRVPLIMSHQNVSSITDNYKIAVLKKWLDLPETQAMNLEGKRLCLVKALCCIGPRSFAEECALDLNINPNVLTRECSDNPKWPQELNDTASISQAVHRPEDDALSQQLSMISGGEAMAARGGVTPAEAPTVTNASAGGATGSAVLVLAAAQPQPKAEIACYRMNRIPRGICLIINNRHFYKDPNRPLHSKLMSHREGTDVDRDRLRRTFEELHFEVLVYENCSDLNMINVMGQISHKDHTDFDCFVCCILTHGFEGGLFGSNGISIAMRDVTNPFRAQACPSLAGKPKLFFMQACQGRRNHEAHDMQTDSDIEIDAPSIEKIPNEADFLLGYATLPGYVSYRSKSSGSWYITKLTDMLSKHAYDYDILSILTLVNKEVSKGDAPMEGNIYKQVPAPLYTLRERLIFQSP